ncbi:MAG: glutamine synthetase III [Mycoplasmataceae bacterium]|nr:glutamine synthetase III [Mycoplasmataceae bacterium]
MKNHDTNILDTYNELVFTDEELKQYVSKDVFEQFKNSLKDDQKEILSLELANQIADAMKAWAISKGATHYTHWFQPMNGVSAEKHESFIEPQKNGSIIIKFSGKELIKGEADGSSFPSGGLRTTFEARGYTAWDASSHAFVRNQTLYIPTIFMSYQGHILDKKIPLHRSATALKNQTLRFVKLFDYHSNHVRINVGAEQEYFLITKEMFNQRLDLKLTGRTLFGARSPKSQELEDHYYGQIKTNVMNFMMDLDRELWRLGIPAKTRHNEVAPCQHELAPVFERVSVAIDHNQLTMEIMKKTAEKYDLVCLLHEKPFANMNGSGKHNNWSISVDGIGNMFNPGDNPETNDCFLLYITSLMAAVDNHQDLLRISVATAGNEHRLGGNEAPPAIVTMFLGDQITEILEAMADAKVYYKKEPKTTAHGVKFVANFNSDSSDRNRTSPLAFTGNKFEFRMPGSSMNLSCVNIMLNTAFADTLQQVCDELEQESKPNIKAAIKRKIIALFKEHRRILFNGNGYSLAWEKEAQQRGLLNLKTVPEALALYDKPKNFELFKRQAIYTETEVNARKIILLEEYCKTIKIESLTMLDILNRQILPAAFSYEQQLSKTCLRKNELGIDSKVELSTLENISNLIKSIHFTKNLLLTALADLRGINDWTKKAKAYRQNVFETMGDLRDYCDKLERLMPKHLWPFPTYADILFN